MTDVEVGDEVVYVEWESKYMECWENASVSNPPQFNYDVRSLYQIVLLFFLLLKDFNTYHKSFFKAFLRFF